MKRLALPRWLALLVLVVIGACQVPAVRQPASFVRPPPGIDPRDPKLPAPLRDDLRRFDIVDKLEFLDRDFSKFVCLAAPPVSAADIDPHRSLFVHDVSTLAARDFSLKRTMDQLAAQASSPVPGTTAASIFRQLWDTQNTAAGSHTTGPHCTDNGQTLNGFALACRHEEGELASRNDAALNSAMNGTHMTGVGFVPLALVNRVDLAHEGWRNCGEFRLIYGDATLAGSLPVRNLIIFEGVLPNPTPGCRSACLPVVQMWKSLSAMNSPADRAAKLEEFFYTGLPGFRPVVHIDHYSAAGATGAYGGSGSGQIRTNQFRHQTRWMLKEFKTVLDCGSVPCKFEVAPIPVKVTPWGELWNEDVANAPSHPFNLLASAFQTDVVAQAARLSGSGLAEFGYSVSLSHNAAQSFSQAPIPPTDFEHFTPSSDGPFAVWTDQYPAQLNSAAGAATAFRTNLGGAAALHGLTAAQLVHRATAQSCAGCHMPGNFGLLAANSIGPSTTPAGATVTSWPDALGFVHVETVPTALPELSGPAFPSAAGLRLSPALHDVFLPARRNHMVELANSPDCPCPSRFLPLRPEPRSVAIRRQDQLLESFEPQAAQWQMELSARLSQGDRLSLADSSRLDERRAIIRAQQEARLADLRKEVGLPSTAPDLKPQALVLSAAQRAKGDAQLERKMRQAEVLGILDQEPPRRTVTGSFRVH